MKGNKDVKKRKISMYRFFQVKEKVDEYIQGKYLLNDENCHDFTLEELKKTKSVLIQRQLKLEKDLKRFLILK